MTPSEFRSTNFVQNPSVIYKGSECPVVGLGIEFNVLYISTENGCKMVSCEEVELVKKNI